MYNKILQTINKIEKQPKKTDINDIEYIQKNINVSYSQDFISFQEFLNLTEKIIKLTKIL